MNAIRRTSASIAALSVIVLLPSGCGGNSKPPPPNEDLAIALRWVAGHPQERQSEVETGLMWALSYLGAELHEDERFLMSWRTDILTLRMDLAGVDVETLPHWVRLLEVMKASDEYRATGAMDIGRFIALTLCSSNHYYALTGASTTYKTARSRYSLDDRPIRVSQSGVAKGARLVEVPETIARDQFAFIAHEGVASVREGGIDAEEHELLDLMPNGQLRFALYDASGSLKSSATERLTNAGKPAKCLWCHESHLMEPLSEPSNPLQAPVAIGSRLLTEIRADLRSKIDFNRKQDHTYAELLYTSFYEPSAARIAGEWNMPVQRVREILSHLPTHVQEEFPFLGDALYRRSDIDALSPYDVIQVPSDPREPSAYEPDLLH